MKRQWEENEVKMKDVVHSRVDAKLRCNSVEIELGK